MLEAAKGPEVIRPCTELFDLVLIITLDDADVFLPLPAEPVPGFDYILIYWWQIIHPIEYERCCDLFAGAGPCAAGMFEFNRYVNDLFDLPGHDIFSYGWLLPSEAYWTCFSLSIARRTVKAAQ
jgi:hypothetical protein